MVDMGLTKEDFHTEWHLVTRKNHLLEQLANSLGDAEMYPICRELRLVLKELKEVKALKKAQEEKNG